MGRRQRHRERQAQPQEAPDNPERQDVIVIPGTAAASGGSEQDSED